MNNRGPLRTYKYTTILAGLLLLTFTSPAYAYVDSGSVSIIITAILGALAMAGYWVRLYWDRFISLFRRGEVKPEDNDNSKE